MTEQETKARYSNIVKELPTIIKGKDTHTENGTTTYATNGELIAELATLTYSIAMEKSPLLESIDDIRLKAVLEKTDVKLAEDFTPRKQTNPLAKAIAENRTYKDGKTPEINQKVNELIKEMKTEVSKNPYTRTVTDYTNKLANYLTAEEREEEDRRSREMQNKERNIEEQEKRTEQTGTRIDMNKSLPQFREYRDKIPERLEPKIRLQVFNELRKLIKNRENQRIENTTKGKIRAQRLGHYPSPYIFSKKSQPKPIVEIHVLIDLSGSMDHHDKLRTAIIIKNELLEWNKNNKQLKFVINGFNAEYYTAEEIGNNNAHANYLMSRAKGAEYNPAGHNSDGFYLKKKMQEMKASPYKTALIILSDGLPAPTYATKNPTLEKQAQALEKSKIPYKSIGLYTQAVKTFYRHAEVLNDIQQLPEIIGRTVRHFIAKL